MWQTKHQISDGRYYVCSMLQISYVCVTSGNGFVCACTWKPICLNKASWLNTRARRVASPVVCARNHLYVTSFDTSKRLLCFVLYTYRYLHKYSCVNKTDWTWLGMLHFFKDYHTHRLLSWSMKRKFTISAHKC